MTLRIARHTDNLEALLTFYSEIIGLQFQGSFKDHAGYNGIFLGLDNLPWHLEFTQSDEMAQHEFDEDDLLVFYPETNQAYDNILDRIQAAGITLLQPKNPYWKENGILIKDPDGYGIIVSALKTSLNNHDRDSIKGEVDRLKTRTTRNIAIVALVISMVILFVQIAKMIIENRLSGLD